jgi:glutamate--cysteine ligase
MTEVVVGRGPATRITGVSDAEDHIAATAFRIGPPRLLGVELEWLVHDADHPGKALTTERLHTALGDYTPPALLYRPQPTGKSPGYSTFSLNTDPVTPVVLLPADSTLTVEPGGQLEISAPPADSLAGCIAAASADLNALIEILAAHGLVLDGAGVDQYRTPHRLLQLPRYSAMEHHYARFGTSGQVMMCSSASVQVCVDVGSDSARRWNLLHQLGPVLVAMFANSPILAGNASGWHSARQRTWSEIDPSRTSFPEPSEDPRRQYAQRALDTDLLCVRRAGESWNSPANITFRDWIEGRYESPPTYDDLDYHLTTLFPPIRAQGHLEVRYIDQQPAPTGWIVPTAVVTALVSDDRAGDLALEAAEPAAARWNQAARDALTDPVLRRAAGALPDIVLGALSRLDTPAAITTSVEEFFQRHTLRGRCPADDLLDASRREFRGE